MIGKTNFEKVIDSLQVQFIQAKHIQVVKPVTVKDDKSLNNRLLILHKGRMSINKNGKTVALYPDRIYCLPSGILTSVTYGVNPIATIPYADPEKRLGNYLANIDPGVTPFAAEILSVIEFNIKAYNAIDFFKFIGLPLFAIESDPQMSLVIKNILEENKNNNLGKEQILNSSMVHFIILLLRYLIDRKLFLQEIGLRVDALMDRRLVDIFAYTANNLKKDLSNATIAKQINLSTEYVGQFFKKMTGMNLQEYIKTIRITKAVELVTTTSKQIQDICKEVGILDFAYFCRIFKEAQGATAKQVQQRAKKAHNKN